MLPLIVQFGIATEDEVAIDTVAERARAIGTNAVIKMSELVSAWARV